jgi:hypothetical protein
MSDEEIQELIKARPDFELLHDQPFEDSKRVRVCGRFTVESLAPHRVVDPEQEQSESETAGVRADEKGYEDTILANLREAGVQNTVKVERLEFSSTSGSSSTLRTRTAWTAVPVDLLGVPAPDLRKERLAVQPRLIAVMPCRSTHRIPRTVTITAMTLSQLLHRATTPGASR